MIMRPVRLDHDLKYYNAVQRRARVTVINDEGYAGIGDIVDFDGKFVTILDSETGERQNFIRENFRFYEERPIL